MIDDPTGLCFGRQPTEPRTRNIIKTQILLFRRPTLCGWLFIALSLAPLASTAHAHTLVAFGDSVTAPRGNAENYSGILASDLLFDGKAIEVVNAGVGGNTTTMALKRFDADLLQKQPDTVVLMFGINDLAVDVWKKPPATEPA